MENSAISREVRTDRSDEVLVCVECAIAAARRDSPHANCLVIGGWEEVAASRMPHETPNPIVVPDLRVHINGQRSWASDAGFVIIANH